MKRIGLVAEGHTDHIVLQSVLTGYFGKDVSAFVTPLQPALDQTDQFSLGGGWNNVFAYCKSVRLAQAFEALDYIIIQVDADVCEQVNFGVGKTHPDGRLKSVEELIIDIIAKFQEQIRHSLGDAMFEQIEDKLIYAISVNEIECWLLPLYANRKKSAINNCTYILNQEISERFNAFIDKHNKSGLSNLYWKVCRPYIKSKEFLKYYPENPSLKYFIEMLDSKNLKSGMN